MASVRERGIKGIQRKKPSRSLDKSLGVKMAAFDKAWDVVKSRVSDREMHDGPIALCDDADRYLELHPSQDVEPDFNCGICDFCHGRK